MRDRVLREAGGVALVLGAILVAVALLSHSPMDPSPFHASTERVSPANWAGWLGATLSAALLSLIGLTALLLPPIGAVLGWRILRQRPLENPSLALTGWLIIVLSLPGLVSLVALDIPYRGGAVPSAGFVGRAASDLLGGFAGPVGRMVILAFFSLIGVLLVSGRSAAALAEAVAARVRNRLEGRRRERLRKKRERQQQQDRRKVLERQLARIDTEGSYRGSLTVKQVEGKGRFRIVRRPAEGAEPPPPAEEPRPEPEATPEPVAPKRPSKPRAREAGRRQGRPGGVRLRRGPRGLRPAPHQLPRRAHGGRSARLQRHDRDVEADHDQVPRVPGPRRGREHPHRAGDHDLRVSARAGGEDLGGPEPGRGPGARPRSESVRIERIPGRATVGIEVPNPDPEVIRLRTLIEAPEFQHAQLAAHPGPRRGHPGQAVLRRPGAACRTC